MESFSWNPLISDPLLFNDFFNRLGLLENIEFNELISLEEDFIPKEEKIHAIILNSEKLIKRENKYNKDKDFFYMKQDDTLTNACGIVAGLHAIGNIRINMDINNNYLKSDSFLYNFLSEKKSPEKYCEILSNNLEIKKINKELCFNSESFNSESVIKHHYTTFILLNNKLIELDGRANGPIIINENISEDNFFNTFIKEIKSRIENKLITEYFSVLYLKENI